MADFTLTRDGDLPLTFEGEKVAEASSHRHQGPGQNRWHELALYRTRGGRWVVSVRFRSCWQGEDDRHEVEHADTPPVVLKMLSALFAETTDGIGYPPGEAYAEKQERMTDDLHRRFELAVSELFSGLADEFAERID